MAGRQEASSAAQQRRALLGGLCPRAFLAEVWQRRPHLARGALPGLRNPLSPQALAGLACDTELPARIVHTLLDGRPWQVEHGPFDAAHFQRLPERDWTLLVQGVDRLVPAVAALRARFDFLPAWRLDDVMVSYAAPGGSVGPHVDSYDVFLVQLHGQRRWQIDTRAGAAADLRSDTPLRILQHFEPQAEWLLGPGDLLYLPPGIPHYGVAEGPCMTYSVGFRAPSGREVWSGYLEHLLSGLDDGGRYTDPDLRPVRHPGAIEESAIDRVMALLEQLPRSREDLAEWFGRHVTEPGPGAPVPGRVARIERLVTALASGDSRLCRTLGQRIAWRRIGRATRVYAAGEGWTLTGALATWARRAGDLPEGAGLPAPPGLDTAATRELLAAWCRLGVLVERKNRPAA